MKTKKLPKTVKAAAIAALILSILTLILASGQIAYEAADSFECWRPNYAMENISPLLEKEALTDGDYSLLYRQTGLTKIGVDRALAKGAAGKTRVLQIQKDYFAKHTVQHFRFAPYICTCNLGTDNISTVYLETGDILVTSSTQLFGWRMGHAGLVINGAGEQILQAQAVGMASLIGDISDFSNRITFMILSPKADKQTKNDVAEYARKNLVGLSYDILRGVFSTKNSVDTTQCAHIAWYAYKQFGVDIDPDGGLITPRGLANSPAMELVQVFGFDPVKLWK